MFTKRNYRFCFLFITYLDLLVGDIDVAVNEGEIETQTVDSTSTDLNSNKDKQPRHDLPAQINEADAIQFINDSFSDIQDEKIHSFYSCKNKECNNLSTDEIKRFSTKVDRFQHVWIMDNKLIYCEKTGYHWLIYEEGHGMYCFICRKHNMENARNKCKKFNLEPGVRFERKAVEDHASSQQHKASVMAELINRTSPFQAELDTKEQTKDSVYFNAFLAIQGVPKKIPPIIFCGTT